MGKKKKKRSFHSGNHTGPRVRANVPRVFFGIPMRYHDGVLEPWVQKCLDLAASYAEDHQSYELECMTWKGSSVTQNSYNLVNKFLTDPKYKSCTHYLYSGDDLTFPPDGIQKLLDADKPVIVGCATWKTPPYWPNCDVMGESGNLSRIHITREMLQRQSIEEVHGAGSGFMMIKREVLEDVARLWEEYHEEFKSKMSEKFNGWEPVPFFPVMFGAYGENAGGKMVSTDFSFCKTVRAAGHKIYLHCGVIVGHVWKKQISILDHLSWRETFGCSSQEQLYPLQEVKPVEYMVEAPKVEEGKVLEPSNS